jgi:hypothetical protein
MNGDYCYHSALTAVTCPSEGAAPVRASDVGRLIARGPLSSTTSEPLGTTSSTAFAVPETNALIMAMPLLLGPIGPEIAPHGSVRSTNAWFTDVARSISVELFENGRRHEFELKAVGRFIGIALAKGCMIPLNLPTLFFARILNLPPTLSDIEREDSALHAHLSGILKRTTDPGEALIIHRVIADGLTDSLSRGQLAALSIVRKAISEVNPNGLAWHSTRAFRNRLVGADRVNPEHLIADWDRSVPVINWLAEIVLEYSQKELRAFVELVTGSPQVPADVGPFRLSVRFDPSIVTAVTEDAGTLRVGTFASREALENHVRHQLNL